MASLRHNCRKCRRLVCIYWSIDPLPTSLLLEFIDDLLPTLTNITNFSLSSSTFPSIFRSAVVKPLPKKASLDPNNLKNFRPVSNLSFMSEITEKVVLQQLLAYLTEHKLISPSQSAYRPHHSTETVLLKITNDILLALECFSSDTLGSFTCSGELRTQKLKSHLVRTQSLNVLPFKPGVGQYIAIHATLTAGDFFLAYFYTSGPFTCIFSKTSPEFFPVLAVANTWLLCRPAE